MKNTTIKQLKRNLSELDKKRMSLINSIDEYNDRIQLPKLKKQYEGNFFIYDNGFNSTDRWTLYIHCKKCLDVNRMVCDRFETDTNGKCEFVVSSQEYYSLCQTQINKEVYIQALRRFKNKFSTLTSAHNR